MGGSGAYDRENRDADRVFVGMVLNFGYEPEVFETAALVGAAPENAWLGTSVENIKQGVPRIARLANVPAATRFLSIEPLLEDLGTLDLTGISLADEAGLGASHSPAMQSAEGPVFLQAVGNVGAGWDSALEGGERADFPGREWDELPLAGWRSQTV